MDEIERILWRIPEEESGVILVFIYRCEACGSLTYPVQHANGEMDYETPDETDVPDKCFNGHKWVLGLWEKNGGQ